ncbi:hypothetical protein BB8028_0006g02350 [Beauveria bassiana]|uniref:Uncharacterized protein n=1 Tax=Beauveria bassiana TaxID=176275 RepID=A0A2S7YIV0_BEABA|nr:hypothetical protein BB8028_0006g02350 [Beauveria bassiana]
MREDPQRDPNSLYSRAEFCDNLLIDIASLPLKDKDRRRSETAQLRLLQWAKSLNVWGDKDANLDSLLDPSKCKVRGLIEAYLEILKETSLLVLKSATPRLPDNHFDIEFAEIELSLTELQTFANLLLFNTKAGFGRRVAQYRSKHDDYDLNNAVTTHIQAQFPHLTPEAPHDVLGRWNELKTKYSNLAEAGSQRASAPVSEPAGLLKVLVNAVLFTHYKTLYNGDYEHKRINATDPKNAEWRLPVESTEVSDSKTEYSHICPVCAEACSELSLSLGPEFCHFLHTTKPYVCLAKECDRNNPPSFETQPQWEAHMQSQHGLDWVCNLNRNVQWVCPTCDAVSPVEFESFDLMTKDLVMHLHSSHGEEISKETFTLARLSYMTCPRPSDTCPICGKRHLYRAAKASRQTANTGSAKDDTHTRVQQCIEEHLFALSFEFTHRRFHTTGAQSQSRSESPSSSSSTPSMTSELTLSVYTNSSTSTHNDEHFSRPYFRPSLSSIYSEHSRPPDVIGNGHYYDGQLLCRTNSSSRSSRSPHPPQQAAQHSSQTTQSSRQPTQPSRHHYASSPEPRVTYGASSSGHSNVSGYPPPGRR